MMSNQRSIKSIIDGRDLYPGEFEYRWQEFVVSRQEKIEEETNNSSLLIEINKLLDQINDKKLRNEIGNIIIARENKATYILYNRGIFTGIKLALSFGGR
jgi:hypothetical protein